MSTTNTDKMFILNDTAKKDPAVQIAMQNYMKQLQAENEYRQKVRAGLITHTPATSWNISDRDWTIFETMKLFIINNVLCDWTAGMAVIAAETKEQCRELFIKEVGEYYADEFDNHAKFIVIESASVEEAGVISYEYGGG